MHCTTIYVHIYVHINLQVWINQGIEAGGSFDIVSLLSFCALNMIARERKDEGATTTVSGLSVLPINVSRVGDYLKVDGNSDWFQRPTIGSDSEG